MPLSKFQKNIFALLKKNRNPDSYVAGGTAIHQSDDSLRYSQDIDLFHDTEESVTHAFESDRKVLTENGYSVTQLVNQPSFYRALIKKEGEQLKLEWVRDTAFRFFPVFDDPELGYRLHPIDLAVNKCIALANRTELRDLLDILEIDKKVLSLAGCCWAACGKDPGFTPDLILEMIQRHSVISPEMLAAEALTRPLDPINLKKNFLKLLDETKRRIKEFTPQDLGCIYLDPKGKPIPNPQTDQIRGAIKHYGSIKGSWPRLGS